MLEAMSISVGHAAARGHIDLSGLYCHLMPGGCLAYAAAKDLSGSVVLL